MTIKAIETFYNGYRFRSRLEARWAVFFDVALIEYDYEPEGYHLEDGIGYGLDDLGWYLPDFWLPQVEMWAEVKARPFTRLEHKKCEALAKGSGYACLMLDGPPAARNYWAYECGWTAEREPEQMDYVLGNYDYHLTESRFYSSTGADAFEVFDLSGEFAGGLGERAILAARQARFEHGESGA